MSRDYGTRTINAIEIQRRAVAEICGTEVSQTRLGVGEWVGGWGRPGQRKKKAALIFFCFKTKSVKIERERERLGRESGEFER